MTAQSEVVEAALSAWFADSGNDKTAMRAALEAAARARGERVIATNDTKNYAHTIKVEGHDMGLLYPREVLVVRRGT